MFKFNTFISRHISSRYEFSRVILSKAKNLTCKVLRFFTLRVPNDNKSAFTLVELLSVVIILSVIVGLAVPNYSRTYQAMRLKSVADRLAYIMRSAQSRSMLKNKNLRLEFHSDFLEYWLTEENNSEGENRFSKFPGQLGKIIKIPSPYHMETDQLPINFYPDGTIEGRYVYVCNQKRCLTISTKEQRRHVWIFDSKIQ